MRLYFFKINLIFLKILKFSYLFEIYKKKNNYNKSKPSYFILLYIYYSIYSFFILITNLISLSNYQTFNSIKDDLK